MATLASLVPLLAAFSALQEPSTQPGLALLPAEVNAINAAAPGSRLATLREMVLQRASVDPLELAILPGRHLVTLDMVGTYVPPEQAMAYGFLQEYNDRLDAIGLAYALTGDAAYAERVARQLRTWSDYAPPMGLGDLEGAQPSIMHRQFYGLFRAVAHAWPALGAADRGVAVRLALQVQDRLSDWWARTDWVRGNHASAANQTGVYAGFLLRLAASTNPELIAPESADRRLARFVVAGRTIPAAAAILRIPERMGLVGAAAQFRHGIVSPANRATYLLRYQDALVVTGCSLDFLYKEPEQRMEYHMIALRQTLLTLWAMERNDGALGVPRVPARLRTQVASLVEFTRPYFETGDPLPGAVGAPPDPATDYMSRQCLGMAAALFPEKTWIRPILDAAEPAIFDEIYFEAAVPFD
jgi:hypothetical protein